MQMRETRRDSHRSSAGLCNVDASALAVETQVMHCRQPRLASTGKSVVEQQMAAGAGGAWLDAGELKGSRN